MAHPNKSRGFPCGKSETAEECNCIRGSRPGRNPHGNTPGTSPENSESRDTTGSSRANIDRGQSETRSRASQLYGAVRNNGTRAFTETASDAGRDQEDSACANSAVNHHAYSENLSNPGEHHASIVRTTPNHEGHLDYAEISSNPGEHHASITRSSATKEDHRETSLLDVSLAASPANASVWARLSSFVGWPARGVPSARALVLAGFYCMGTGDSVRCFYCGVTLSHWRENDDPWVTHVLFRFSCDYVTAVKGENFVLRTQIEQATGQSFSDRIHYLGNAADVAELPSQDSAQYQLCQPNGQELRTDSDPSTAAQHEGVLTTHESNPTTSNHHSTPSSILTRERPSSPPRNRMTNENEETILRAIEPTNQHLTNRITNQDDAAYLHNIEPTNQQSRHRFMINEDEEAYLNNLEATNQRLRQRVTCRVCRSRSVNTIFLPCGHLCTCDSCASTVRDCCLCGEQIRGTAHVHME